MDIKDQIFLVISAVLILFISLSGPQLNFYSLNWHLTVTPGGLLYSMLFGGEQFSYLLNYLTKQEMTSSVSLFQIIGAFTLSLSGIIYTFSKSDKTQYSIEDALPDLLFDRDNN